MKNLISKEEKNRIIKICRQYKISNYKINSDGSIDVDGDVRILETPTASLPLKFGKLSGNFTCSGIFLTSLEGSPHTVGCIFDCSINELKSLVGGPSKADYFKCQANHLTSLVGGPVEVKLNYNCCANQLTSLNGSPSNVNDFLCHNNELTTLMGGPISVGGDFICHGNKLTSLEGAPETIGGIFHFGKNVLRTTYSENSDIEVGGEILFDHMVLPQMILQNAGDIKLILKYQRHYMIWNEDLTLNEANFNDLIADIKDGLE